MTHAKNFVDDVILETDVVRGRLDTMSGLPESIVGSPKPERKSCNLFRGTTALGVLPFGHPIRIEANPGHAARTRFCCPACTNILSLLFEHTALVVCAQVSGCIQKPPVSTCKPTWMPSGQRGWSLLGSKAGTLQCFPVEEGNKLVIPSCTGLGSGERSR